MICRTNLETGGDYFYIPLIFRGVGASLLIVPLTALALSALKPADIPQGAALNYMMRQMGSSFRIAWNNTHVAYRAAYNRTALVSILPMPILLPGSAWNLLRSTSWPVEKTI